MDTDKFLADDFKNTANLTGSVEDAKEANKLKKEIWDDLHKTTIPRLKHELRKSFQELLGIKDSA